MRFVVYVVAAATIAAPRPADPAALSDEAARLAKAKRFDEAVQLWNRALDADARFFPALFNLGFFYFTTNQFEAAAPMLARAATVEPDHFNTRYVLGATLSRLNRTDEALRHWRAGQKLQPGNLRLLQLMTVEYAKGRYFNEAAAAARTALEQAPDDANLYFLAIKALQDAGDQAGGAEIAKRAVERFPASARANLEHGFYLQKNGDIDNSIRFLKRAIEFDAAYEEPPFFLGDLLLKIGRTEEAIPYLKKAIAVRADYVPARVLLARALMKLDKQEAALLELKETVRLAPTHPQPHLLLSQFYFRMGDEESARKERELSIELRRRNPTLLEAIQGRPYQEE